MVYQSLIPIKLDCTTPVREWLQPGCSNEVLWQKLCLPRLSLGMSPSLIHQCYPQSIDTTSLISRKYCTEGVSEGKWSVDSSYGKETLSGQFDESQRLPYIERSIYCSVSAKSWRALWFNSLDTSHGQFDDTFILTWETYCETSFFCTLQYSGQGKQITVSNTKHVGFFHLTWDLNWDLRFKSRLKLSLKLRAMVHFSHVGFPKPETIFFTCFK